MTREEFLSEFQEILQTDDPLSFEIVLNEMEEWDSLAVLSTLAMLDAVFGVKATMADFENMKTIEDIAQKAGI